MKSISFNLKPATYISDRKKIEFIRHKLKIGNKTSIQRIRIMQDMTEIEVIKNNLKVFI